MRAIAEGISDRGLMGLRLATVAEKLQDLPKLRAGKFDRKLAAIGVGLGPLTPVNRGP